MEKSKFVERKFVDFSQLFMSMRTLGQSTKKEKG